MPSVHDWLIVGAGMHGACAARALTAGGADVVIVDSSDEFFGRWTARARAVGMVWLRSSVDHHIDGYAADLHHFAHRQPRDRALLAGTTYKRPLHELFLDHCRAVVERDGLQPLLRLGKVEHLRRDGSSWLVDLGHEQLRARRVLLATGARERHLPRRLIRGPVRIGHAFEPRDLGVHPVVVGGGLSAVQVVIKLVRRSAPPPVHLIMRRTPLIREFDFETRLARKSSIRRWQTQDSDARLRALSKHPHRGCVPPALWRRLSRLVRQGYVHLTQGGEIQAIEGDEDRVLVHHSQGIIEGTGVLAATGLQVQRVDTSSWLASLAASHDLPTIDGLPKIDRSMEWGRGIYVSGPLARYGLGPIASNLVGARFATESLPGAVIQV